MSIGTSQSLSVTIDNADNQVVVFVNGANILQAELDQTDLPATKDLSSYLDKGSNSILIVGINWGGPYNCSGTLVEGGTKHPWGKSGSSPANGIVMSQHFVVTV